MQWTSLLVYINRTESECRATTSFLGRFNGNISSNHATSVTKPELERSEIAMSLEFENLKFIYLYIYI